MAYPGYDTFCRDCGKPIIFIRTEAGRFMPCDAEPVDFWPAEAGGVLVYQRDGTAVKAKLSGHPQTRAGLAYKPHWASCTRKSKRAAPERKPTPAQLAVREQIKKERAAREAREAKEAAKREAARLLREAEERQERLF